MAGAQICADSEQSVKVFCKASSNKALGMTGDKPRFVDYDCADEIQTWLRIQSGDIGVKGFVLVHKDTQKAISRPLVGPVIDQEVVSVPYKSGSFDNLSLWSEKDGGNGLKSICAANDATLSLEVDMNTQGIKIVVNMQTSTQPPNNQLWDISPQISTVCCKAYPSQALAAINGELKFFSPYSSDINQLWMKIMKTADETFALVNKAISMALRNRLLQVMLVPYNDILEQNLLSSESEAQEDGYKTIMISNTNNLNLDADKSSEDIKVVVQTSNNQKISQLWKISPST